MKIHDCEQGSDEWLAARAGVVSASEFSRIVKQDFTPRKSDGVESYMHQKLAEKWTGGPLHTFHGSGDAEQGILREPKARRWLALELGVEIQQVGFITTDDGRKGCSPDGLITEFVLDGTGLTPTQLKDFIRTGYIDPSIMPAPRYDNGGCEIKNPTIETHIGYLLDNVLPVEHAAQVHGSIYVTGAPWWYFCSYRPPMPALVIKVERDEEIQKKLHDSLTGFLERFDMAWARLLTRGEPPARTYAPIPERVYPEPDIWRNSQ